MKTLVLYDGDCGICSVTARTLERLDRHARLTLLPLQTPGVLEPHGVTLEEAEKALHTVTPGGGVYRAGEALRVILAALPWLWPAQYLWRLPGVPYFAERFYYLIAENRHTISRLTGTTGACSLPKKHL